MPLELLTVFSNLQTNLQQTSPCQITRYNVGLHDCNNKLTVIDHSVL